MGDFRNADCTSTTFRRVMKTFGVFRCSTHSNPSIPHHGQYIHNYDHIQVIMQPVLRYEFDGDDVEETELGSVYDRRKRGLLFSLSLLGGFAAMT